MIDREKVIKGLEVHIKPNSRCVGCPYPNNGLCGDQLYHDALILLKEQETTFEKDGHHIRCISCGNYWCDTDSEGDLFPHNYCPHCGRKVKLE